MSAVPFRLVLKNLLKHPVRTFLTVGSLTVALFLLCLLRSIVVSLKAGVEGARSDRFIVQSAVSLFVYLPQGYEPKILGVEGVEACCAWNWFGGYYQRPGNFFAQFAVDQETFLPMFPEITIEDGSAGEFLANRRGSLIGVDLVRDFGWRVGDPLPIISALFPHQNGAWEFVVSGIYRSSETTVDNRTMFFHYKYLEETLEQGGATGPPGVGIYYVQLQEGAEASRVMAAIDALFENGPQRVQSTSEAEFQAQFVSMVGNIPFFVSSIGSGVFLAILLAVVNTMLMAAREQTRDVGILKALGFDSRTVSALLLLQSLVLALSGGGLGVALARASEGFLATLLGTVFPFFEIDSTTILLGCGVSVAIGLLAGIAPAWMASHLNPVESLRRGR